MTPDAALTTNYDIVAAICVITQNYLKEHPESDIASVVFFATREVLKSKVLRSELKAQLSQVVYAYYLKTYDKYMTDHSEEEVKDDRFYIQAALNIFDEYIKDPSNHMARQIVSRASAALSEVYTHRLSITEKIKITDAMYLNTAIVVLNNSVKQYLASGRRFRNLSYIEWLKDLYTEALVNGNLTLSERKDEIDEVIDQVRRNVSQVQLRKLPN